MASTFIHDPEQVDLGDRSVPISFTGTPVGRAAAVVALLVVLCASLWAIAEYAEHKAEVRRAETERYVRAFEVGPVADAWAGLVQTWDTPTSRRVGLPAEAGEAALGAEIETVLGYFRGYALCVRAGNCDAERARLHLGDLPWRFRDRHLDHLEETFPDVPFDHDLTTLVPRGDLELLGP